MGGSVGEGVGRGGDASVESAICCDGLDVGVADASSGEPVFTQEAANKMHTHADARVKKIIRDSSAEGKGLHYSRTLASASKDMISLMLSTRSAFPGLPPMIELLRIIDVKS